MIAGTRYESKYSLPIRPALKDACKRAWRRLVSAGTWLDAATRRDVALETRAALDCELCAQRKGAVSPFAVDGKHATTTQLPDHLVECVHRIRTDSGRLSERWYREQLDAGLSDAEYIEIVGVVATMAALDTFDLALGLPEFDLDPPVPGEPSRRRPDALVSDYAWVATVEPRFFSNQDDDPYPGKTPEQVFNINRALSLVPAECRGFFDLDDELYLPQYAIRDFTSDLRNLTHSQMELLASRVAALNQCDY